MLHVNIGKRKMAHWSLFCDERLADFDALSVVEPYIYEDLDTGEPAFPVERNWQLPKPSMKREGEARYANRATIWVNRRHAAQQVAVPSSDGVAVTIPASRGATLIVFAYDVKSTDGQAAIAADGGWLRVLRTGWTSTPHSRASKQLNVSRWSSRYRNRILRCHVRRKHRSRDVCHRMRFCASDRQRTRQGLVADSS